MNILKNIYFKLQMEFFSTTTHTYTQWTTHQHTCHDQGNHNNNLNLNAQQVKEISAETDNQGGGQNHTSREGGSETRGEVNTHDLNRDKTITWTDS